MEEAQALADRVAVISGGRIVAAGTPATIGGRDTALARIRFARPAEFTAADLPANAVLADGLVTVETAEPTRILHELTGWALRHGTVLDQLTVDRPSIRRHIVPSVARHQLGTFECADLVASGRHHRAVAVAAKIPPSMGTFE